MPFTLVTGLPRNGKTLYTIAKTREWFPGRPVRYIGIDKLKEDVLVGWSSMTEHELQLWEDLPPQTVVVIDECHKYFPTRGLGQPPKWIEKLTEHGHKGLDFVFITQHPMNFDHFIRRLVQVHFHVKRIFGTEKAAVMRGIGYCDISDHWAVKDMEKSVFNYPKDLYGVYHSADAHTVKRRLPPRLFAYGFFLAVVVVGIVFVAHRVRSGSEVKAAVAAATGARPGDTGQVVPPGRASSAVTPWNSLAERTQFIPRDGQFPYSAPGFDLVRAARQVLAAPIVQGCFQIGETCRCLDQQATDYPVDDATCHRLLKRHFDPYYVDRRPPSPHPVTAMPVEGTGGGLDGAAGLQATQPAPSPIGAPGGAPGGLLEALGGRL